MAQHSSMQKEAELSEVVAIAEVATMPEGNKKKKGK